MYNVSVSFTDYIKSGARFLTVDCCPCMNHDSFVDKKVVIAGLDNTEVKTLAPVIQKYAHNLS